MVKRLRSWSFSSQMNTANTVTIFLNFVFSNLLYIKTVQSSGIYQCILLTFNKKKLVEIRYLFFENTLT